MFDPTNSDDQKLENLRKKTKRIKLKKKNSVSSFHSSDHRLLMFVLFFYFLLFFSFSLVVGPTCPFITLFSPFQPRNNLFCPGFNFLYHN